VYTPMIAVPRQNSAKLDSASASAQVALPATATNDPVMKPRRRPTLAIQSEAGIAATAEPSTNVVAPAVANALFPASAYPTRPFIAISAELLTSSNA
jgi:hypothetical protein